MPKDDANQVSAIAEAAKKIKPTETRPVKRPALDVSSLRLGDVVTVQPVAGRQMRQPGGGFYDHAQTYLLMVTVTLLRQIRQGDWLPVDAGVPQ